MKALLSGMIVFSLFPKTAIAEEDVPQGEGSDEIVLEDATEDATEEILYSEEDEDEELPASDEGKPAEEISESEITEPVDEQEIEEEPVATEEVREPEEEILESETIEPVDEQDDLQVTEDEPVTVEEVQESSEESSETSVTELNAENKEAGGKCKWQLFKQILIYILQEVPKKMSFTHKFLLLRMN